MVFQTAHRLQARLLLLAGLFLGLYSLALTLSPAVRARSWEVDYRWGHWAGYLAWVALFVFTHHQTGRRLPERDAYLVPLAALLSGWGLMTIWRLLPGFGWRQSIWLVLAVGLLILGLRLPDQLAFLRRYKYLWLTSGLLLTALTLIFGSNPASGPGPRLWLGCCGIYFQPSEPLKLLLVVYLAAYFADKQFPFNFSNKDGRNENARSTAALLGLLAPTLIMTGLALGLLLVQRDLGTATIFIFLYAILVYLATGRALILLVSALILSLAGAAGYYLFDVVRLRVEAWLNPWLDPSGRSYQIVQSLLSAASGGLFGRGPGVGYPLLVPVSHSDFIFSAIVEEGGLLGAIGLIACLFLLAARGLRLALRAPDNFRRYLAGGLTAYLVFQSMLIIGGNLRLLPLTGVTLPFVSYGGSSLVTAFVSLLILLLISKAAESSIPTAPASKPYLHLGAFLFAILAATALVAGWWTYYRGPALLERTDNTRRSIADRFVRRGALLDRHHESLAVTLGEPGSLERRLLYSSLGPVLGYTNPNYGQSGLEASLDPYLRGLRGNPGLTIWWNHLLYGQPPPGLDVRLSLDVELQRAADELLGGHTGAVVLLNAESGEVLVMASHPTFDPNTLDEDWEQLMSDPRRPLLNRATLGRYQPGGALTPLLLAAVSMQGALPSLPDQLGYTSGNMRLECAQLVSEITWERVVGAGCPGPQALLGSILGEARSLDLFNELGLYSAPVINLPSDSLPAPLRFTNPQEAFLGDSQVSASPLQMALAAATLSNRGLRPAPQLAMAVNTPKAGWVVLPPLSEPVRVFPQGVAERTASSLASEGLPAWWVLARSPDSPGKSVSWYLGGTLPSWNGAPLVWVVLLEEDNPALAKAIGQALIMEAIG